jgi:hypothetical protein
MAILIPVNNVEEVVMQKSNLVGYILIGLALCLPSCQPRVDVDKERDAIKAVIEEEKNGYFDKSLERMAATWVQKSSSVKMFTSQEGELDLFGWAKINEQSKKEIAGMDPEVKNIHVDFSDFQFNIYQSSAWAIFKAKWNWTYKEEQQKLEQTRIMAFEKTDGKWKITLMAIYAVPTERTEVHKSAK